MSDPIVAEVREQRSKILESHGWDFRAMSLDAMRRQFETSRKIVKIEKRIPQPGSAPNAYPLRKPS